MAEIVTSPVNKHPKRKKVLIVTGIVVLIVAAVGAGAGVRWLQDRDEQPDVVSELPPLPESVQEAQDLLAEGKVEEADRLVKENLNRDSLSNEERFELYSTQGLIAYEKQDYQEAAAAYERAFEIQETFDMARKLGTTLQQLGDNQGAITYYRRAIELNPPDNPVRESDNNILEQMISALEEDQQ